MDLETTNLLLGIIAGVNVLYALVLLGIGFMAFRLYRLATATLTELERRHVAPIMQKVNGILGDVQGVTAQVRMETERVDQAIHSAIDRVDETADRVRMGIGDQARRVVGVVRGVRAAIQAILTGTSSRRSEAHASGHM